MAADGAGSCLHSDQPHACSQNDENGEAPERTNDFSSHFFSFRSQVNTTFLRPSWDLELLRAARFLGVAIGGDAGAAGVGRFLRLK